MKEGWELCPYCGHYLRVNHFCKENPKAKFSEEPIEYVEGFVYSPKQKIKFKCSQCGKESVLYYRKFKLSQLCLNCRLKQSSKNINWQERKVKSEKTCIEKYGVKNYGSLSKHREAVSKANKENKKERLEKFKKTSLEKYGVEHPTQNKRVKEKTKQTCLKKYGVEAVSQNKEIRQKQIETCFKCYGVENYSQTKEAREKSRHIWKLTFEKNKGKWIKANPSKKFEVEDIYFDSYPEVCFFLYCRDHNLNICRNEKSFSYTYQNKIYHYFPDFEIGGKYYEIKGTQFLTEDNKWRNPFDHSLDEKYEAKHQCTLQNNVTILYKKDYQKYIDFVEKEYGESYLNQFKIEKNI